MDANEPLAAGSEVLSQSEVERLLAQVAEQESKATVVKSDGGVEARLKDSIQPYDFRNPAFLASGELRRMRIEHERYIAQLAAALSIYLRMEVGLQMAKLQTITYSQFTETIGAPAHLSLFKVEPFRGICVLDLNPRLGLAIADRLMGGAGHAPHQAHELSEIEAALLDQAVQIILSEWCKHWQNVQEVRSVIIGHENSGQFLQTAHSDTMMLVLTLEARLGDCLESIQMAFPYATIEPLVRHLNAKLHAEAELTPPPTAAAKPRWNAELEQASIPVTAEWPSLEMTARDLTQLKIGDVLALEPEVVNEVRLRLASMPKFTGRLGTKGAKWAVEITKALK